MALQVTCRLAQCAEPTGIPATAALYRARVDLEDRHAPDGVRLSGELAEGRAVAGRPTLVVSGSDRGAGVAAMTVSVDGGPSKRVDVGGDGCRQPYERPRPCPAEAFEVDAMGLADGHHVASGTVVDAAGNVTSWQQAFAVRGPVAAAGPPAVGDPVPTAPASAALGGERPVLRHARRLVRHRPRRVAEVRGHLRTAAGTPVPGARLTVTKADLGVRKRQRVARDLPSVTTDGRGAFKVRLRLDGAQLVTIAYTVGGLTVRESATVRSRLSLHVHRAAAARLVKGRSLTTVFSFRAVAKRTAGWPWRTRRSRPFEVRVDVP